MEAPNKLRELREGMGWSRRTLAEKAGVPEASIQNWEQGRSPLNPDNPAHAHYISSMALAMNVDPTEIVDAPSLKRQERDVSSILFALEVATDMSVPDNLRLEAKKIVLDYLLRVRNK
jgi:transcriptional regulator with XRE-family HTH domain